MPVPRPPLSFSTTVSLRRDVLGETEIEVALTRSGDGVMVDSGMIPVLPDTRDLKVDSKAEIADEAIPSASILVLMGSKDAMVMVRFITELYYTAMKLGTLVDQ